MTSQFPIQPSGYYQWIDCSTNLPISGATNQSFTPTQTGSYAVVITDANCFDTSAYHTVFVPLNESASACDDYTWTFNNQTHSTSGTYIDSIPTLGGYQVATLNLTLGIINPYSLVVADSSGTLYSQSTLANYQWIDCATNLPISGATNQSFSPTQSGSYAVIVSDSICSDTSACTTVQVSGVELMSTFNLSLVPNPTKDHVTVTFDGEEIHLGIVDIKGRLIYSKSILRGERVDLSLFEAGVYLFNFQSSGENEIHRVVRE